MSTENLTGAWSQFRAGADFSSAGQFRFVSVAADLLQLTGAGALADGVLQDEPESGESGFVVPLNGSISKMEAGAAVSADDDIASDATGRAVTAVTADEILGHAVDAASAAGEIIRVIINRRGITP